MLLNILLGEGTTTDQKLGVPGQGSRLLLNGLVHPRLGETRLIGFVVTVSTVADDIDDDILFELGTVVGSKLAYKVHSLDVVTIDMEDGGIDGLGDIGGVRSGTGETRIGGEPDLVVDNQVDGTSSSI